MNKEELKEKFLQSFIVGYKTETPTKEFLEHVSNGLGGIIFFAENLKNRKKFKNLISKFKNTAKIPLFLSIDQEGGLVERTIFLDEKVEYLTPATLSNIDDEKIFKKHYEILAEDLIDLGINMNFAPVLDVNSNPANPIIGVRSYGNNVEIVNKYSKYVIDVFKENNIITCGKHFAGHGDTSVDSHKNMPYVNCDFEEFYKNHIVCFEKAIKNNIDTIMISHIHFSFFDKEKTPCSLSKNAIYYLQNQLNFKGLVISDDMVMGGISKQYGLKESIVLALTAGIEVLLFQHLSKDLIDAIDKITEFALKDKELQNIILKNYKKIMKFKQEKLKPQRELLFDVKIAQKEIDDIAKSTIKIYKKDGLPISKQENIKIISFDNKSIFNLSTREKNLSDYLENYQTKEMNYPLNPNENDIEKVLNKIQDNDLVIFISYNAQVNRGQVELFNQIKNKKILVSCGLECDIPLFGNAESIISLSCAKTPSLKKLAEILTAK